VPFGGCGGAPIRARGGFYGKFDALFTRSNRPAHMLLLLMMYNCHNQYYKAWTVMLRAHGGCYMRSWLWHVRGGQQTGHRVFLVLGIEPLLGK